MLRLYRSVPRGVSPQRHTDIILFKYLPKEHSPAESGWFFTGGWDEPDIPDKSSFYLVNPASYRILHKELEKENYGDTTSESEPAAGAREHRT